MASAKLPTAAPPRGMLVLLRRAMPYAELPNPTRVVFKGEDVGELRRMDCVYNDRCLDRALVNEWPGFSCMKCHAFALAPSALRQAR